MCMTASTSGPSSPKDQERTFQDAFPESTAETQTSRSGPGKNSSRGHKASLKEGGRVRLLAMRMPRIPSRGFSWGWPCGILNLNSCPESGFKRWGSIISSDYLCDLGKASNFPDSQFLVSENNGTNFIEVFLRVKENWHRLKENICKSYIQPIWRNPKIQRQKNKQSNSKLGKGRQQTFLQRRPTNGQ